MQMTLGDVAHAVGGALVGAAALQDLVQGASIDSRTLQPGEAFFALPGARVDGHSFCASALERGATLLVVERPVDLAGAVCLVVPSVRQALADLARAWRRRVNPMVVAITGSMGKTTTKELTLQVLAEAGPVHGNRGNFNNELGLPLTLLAMPAETRIAVLELGMSAPQEIARLAAIAEPQLGLITNIAPVHLEGLGSLEAIAAAKAELLDALPEKGLAVVPDDEPLLEPHLTRCQAQVVRFGTTTNARVRLAAVTIRNQHTLIELQLAGTETTSAPRTIHVELPLLGKHNALNATAAAAVAWSLGVSADTIAASLARPPALVHRSTLRALRSYTVIDDCYNASPRAVIAALETLCAAAPPDAARWAVLGAMLELGSRSDEYHAQVGAVAARLKLDRLIVVGPQAAPIADGAIASGLPRERVTRVEAPAAAATLVTGEAPAGSWILLKGSRGARLERFFEAFEASAS